MKKKAGILITLIFLGYGIIRIGVGAALLLQETGILNLPELSEAVEEVRIFITGHHAQQLIPFSPASYFLYILIMGILLTAGAVGIIRRKNVGFTLLWIYLLSHGSLFINFQEINPKIFVLAGQLILLLLLYYLLPSTRLIQANQTASTS